MKNVQENRFTMSRNGWEASQKSIYNEKKCEKLVTNKFDDLDK